MNGFKFTDLKCLAMMVLIIMAFCGDAGQYLLMAAALVWMFAKVLELHRSRRKEPPAQKGKAAAKPATAPAVQPVQASRPAAPVQQPKPAVPRPQLIDPEREGVMLRHINFRITEKLQGAFPSAVWRWETAKPLEQAVKGGSARIRLSGVPNWNFADVLFERSGRIRLEMLSLRPLEEMQKPAKEGPVADGDPDSVNLQNWYVIPREVEQVCRHIAQTTGSQNPMRNIMFRGPAGTGKTEGAKAIAAGLGIPYTFLTCSANTEVFDLLGQVLPKMEADAALCSGLPSLMDIQMDPASAYCQMTGEYREDVTENEVLQKMVELKAQELGDGLNGNSFRYVDTPLVKAMRYGYLVELQEPAVIANPGVLVGLNSLLDRCASITLPNGERIQRHPETVVVW